MPPLFVNDDEEKENHEEAESSPPEEPVPEAVPQPQPPVPPVAAAEAASKAQKQPPSAPTTATTAPTSGSGARARGGSRGYASPPNTPHRRRPLLHPRKRLPIRRRYYARPPLRSFKGAA